MNAFSFRIAALLLAIVALAGAWALRGHRVEVDAIPVRTGTAVELVYANGYVEAEEPVAVASRLTAPVARIFVDEGDRVRAGQPLALLEDSEQRATLTQASAERRGADLDAGRKRSLAQQGWVTRAQRDQAVTAAQAARAAEHMARARLDQTVLRAGINGVVLKRDVEAGDLALPSRTLFLLGDPARVRVTATVDERDMPRIRVGQKALMSSDALPGRILHGHVRDITPGGDPTQRAFRARIALDTADAALPLGLTLEVNIITRRADRALLVPAKAYADGRVWTIEDGRAHRRSVRAGIVGSDAVQIISGLGHDALVIAQPPEGLDEGDRVRPK